MSIYLKKCIVPQSAVMTQSDWPVATVNRSADNSACVTVSCNAFICSQTWMTWKFDIDMVIKNHMMNIIIGLVPDLI